MEPFFTLAVSIEPDRQRFARFALEAAETLGGTAFAAVPAVVEALRVLRQGAAGWEGAAKAQLAWDKSRLFILFCDAVIPLCSLPAPPERPRLSQLAERLRKSSETADPELLKRRNQKIKDDLERYMRESARQMAEIEAALEKKKAELQESIRHARTDSLTGLLNRGAFDERLSEAVLRCRRQQQPLSLALLDLDDFKCVNDTYGHQFGDRYLQRMAGAMQEASRMHVDQLFRIGGDEFAMIIFADLPISHRIANAVLSAMDGCISAGVAQLGREDHEMLVERADRALYEAKRQGRGRVILEGLAATEVAEVANGR